MDKSFDCCEQTHYSHMLGPQRSLAYAQKSSNTYQQFRASL